MDRIVLSRQCDFPPGVSMPISSSMRQMPMGAMLPCDHGDAQAFRRRLDQEYGNQLSTYQAVPEYLTGGKVIEAKLLAI